MFSPCSLHIKTTIVVKPGHEDGQSHIHTPTHTIFDLDM